MIGFGGNYDPQLNSILGDSALEQLSHLNITKAFVSGFGLDDNTATTNHERQAGILRKVLDAAVEAGDDFVVDFVRVYDVVAE